MDKKDIKILVYHHYDNLSLMITHLLEYAGFNNCVRIVNEEDIIKLSLNNPPHLLILDLKMERTNACEVLRHIKKINPGYDPLVIALGCDDKKETELGIDTNEYIADTLSIPEVLLSKVKKVLSPLTHESIS